MIYKDTSTPPRVSVLMPAYNSEKYVTEAIDSVLKQTYTDFELIVVNDGSADDTEKKIKELNDPRIIVLTQTNQGVASALNKGLSVAKGEYICRFDADDICFNNRIEKQVAFLDLNPDYILVGSDAEYITEDGNGLFNFSCIGHTHEEIMNKLYFYCPFIHSAVMYRKKEVIDAGSYSAYAHNFEDYLLWTQLSKKGKFHNLKERLVKIRFNPSSVTIDEKWRGRRFRELKKSVIHKGTITKEEGDEIFAIIKSQDTYKIKEGSYHTLCAKKYLADNYQPEAARRHLLKAIKLTPLHMDIYALFVISFMPQNLIKWAHNQWPNKL